MANGLAAFAVGLGSGYLTAQQRGRDQERQSRLDAQNSELHGLRMDEANAAKNLRMGLADAVKPAALNESAPTLAMADGTKTAYDSADTAGSDFRQLRRNDEATGQQTLARATLADGANLPGETVAAAPTPGIALNGKAFDGDITQARAAQTAYNTPQAQAQRIGMAYSANGKPVEAMQYQKSVDDMEQAKKDRFSKLQSEGAVRTARAMLSGSPEDVFRTFNAQGNSKLKEAPTVTTEDVEMPGIGKVKNHIFSGIIVDANGQEKPFTMSSHDANMAMMNYKDMLEVQRKGLSGEGLSEHRAGLLELRGEQNKLQNELGLARIEAAKNKPGASGQPTREERLRYTTLFQDAGRQATQAQKSISALMKDPLFAIGLKQNPNGPEAQEMNALKEALKRHNEERTLYQGMLVESQTTGAASASEPGNASPSATKVPPQVQQSRDGDRLSILNAELKKATEQGNQADIDSLTREIGREKPAKPGLANARPTDSKPAPTTTASGRPPLSSFNR